MHTIKTEIRDCGILIIEDDNLGRVVLTEIFRQQGFTRIEVAVNGIEGLKKIREFKPDLIILDVLMPEMDGVECCTHIRQSPDPKIANVPILFQTALDGLGDKTRLFAAGATDCLIKPIDPHELTARAVVHLEHEIMTRTLREFSIRMTHELDTARDTQRILIPSSKAMRDMERDYNLEISGHYQPSSELGGDFWGFKSLSSEELAIYMVDFSGHGVNAALNVFRLHALMQSAMNTASTPGAYLTNLNAMLAPMLPVGQFATMFYGVMNTKHNKLAYASAAAPAGIVFTGRGKGHRSLENAGDLLGVSKESSYQTHEVEFLPGDGILLYSDALIETPNTRGNLIDDEEVGEVFETSLKHNPFKSTQALEHLLVHFNDHSKGQLIEDDLTLSSYFRANT